MNREKEKQPPDHAAALQAVDEVLRAIQARPRANWNPEETLAFDRRWRDPDAPKHREA